MGDKKAFQDKVAKILSNILSKETVQIPLNDDTDLIDDIGLNSLDFLQFIIQLENEFDIEIDIEKFELRYFKQLGRLESFIDEILSKKNVFQDSRNAYSSNYRLAQLATRVPVNYAAGIDQAIVKKLYNTWNGDEG